MGVVDNVVFWQVIHTSQVFHSICHGREINFIVPLFSSTALLFDILLFVYCYMFFYTHKQFRTKIEHSHQKEEESGGMYFLPQLSGAYR
jgi:hypothetical protein